MYKAVHLSRMIPSYNISGTATFFKDLLGFTQEMDSPGYAILSKDVLTVHLLNAGANIGEMEFYLEVDNVDAVWNAIKDQLEGIKERAPFDREYGMREIHVAIPHTNTLLFIGSVIRK